MISGTLLGKLQGSHLPIQHLPLVFHMVHLRYPLGSSCWSIVGKDPDNQLCVTFLHAPRMISEHHWGSGVKGCFLLKKQLLGLKALPVDFHLTFRSVRSRRYLGFKGLCIQDQYFFKNGNLKYCGGQFHFYTDTGRE